MKIRTIAANLLLFSVVATAADKVGDRTVMVNSDNDEMATAIQEAQATLDDFLKIKANPPKGASGFKLKVEFSDKYGTEHIWVTPFKTTNSGFVGTLAGQPNYVRNVKNGQQITFKRAEVSDWGYVQDGKQKGSFTVCVVFKQMPAADVQRYRDDYGFEC